MKKKVIAVTVVLAVSLLATTALAQMYGQHMGPGYMHRGWGMEPGYMHYGWGMGPGHMYGGYGYPYGKLDPEKEKAYREA